MDPATLSVAAVALLVTGFGNGFAQEAGKSAWEAVQKVGRAVAARLAGTMSSSARWLNSKPARMIPRSERWSRSTSAAM